MGAIAAAAAELFATGGTAVTASGSAAAAAGTSSLAATAATAGAVVAGGKLLSDLKPDAPELKPVTPMPDPLEQQKAKERSIIEQMSRRGRSASILTDTGSATLGGG
jgi:hypothetical protein